MSYYISYPLREDIKMLLIYPEREHNRLTVTGKKNSSEGTLRQGLRRVPTMRYCLGGQKGG